MSLDRMTRRKRSAMERMRSDLQREGHHKQLALLEMKLADLHWQIAAVHVERNRILQALHGEPISSLAERPGCPIDLVPLSPPARRGVYAIGGVGGFVKIGRAEDIRTRITELQVAHPLPLRLWAILDDDPANESEYLRRFARMRVSGEWFVVEPELRAAIYAARGAALS